MEMEIIFCLTKTVKLAIILPVLAVQFGLAVFCLSKLAACDFSVKKYILWNIFIVFVFFIGGVSFLVYYFCNRKKFSENKEKDIIIDAPLVDAPKPNGQSNDNVVENVVSDSPEKVVENVVSDSPENVVENVVPDTPENVVEKDKTEE